MRLDETRQAEITTKVDGWIRDLRADLHEAISYQSLRFFQAHPTGTILSRILADVARLQKVSTDVLADFVRVGAVMPIILAVALVQDRKLTLVAMVALLAKKRVARGRRALGRSSAPKVAAPPVRRGPRAHDPLRAHRRAAHGRPSPDFPDWV